MLALRFYRSGRLATSCLAHRYALRQVTVELHQRKLQEATYDGANEFLQPSRFEKREELRTFRDTNEISSPEQREATDAIKDLIACRKYSQAVDVFKQVPERNAYLYGAVLSACAKGLLYDAAMDIWNEMPQDYKGNVTYSIMLDLCRRTKRVQLAEMLMSEMIQAGIKPNIVTQRTLIGVYSMMGDTSRAMEVFAEIRSTSLNEASQVSKQMTYLAVMSAFSRRGDYKTVKELFEEMTNAGIPPDHTHFNSLLTSCVRDGYMDIAEAIIELMPKWGLNPRSEDFTALISACRHDLLRCKAAYEKMLEAGAVPAFVTYKNLILAYMDGGDYQGAQELLAKAEKVTHVNEDMLARLRQKLQMRSE